MDFSLMITGAVLGITAGLSPGPTQTFLISQTVKHGVREGILIAFVPLMTDVPIFLLTVGVLSQISDVDPVMGVLSLIGAVFLGYLAYGNFKITALQDDQTATNPGSIRKGIMTNFLNPYPYMFWLLVGAPLLLNAYETTGAMVAGFFILGFYGCLVGVLMLLAAIAGKSRILLKGKGYVYTLRVLGVLLIIFALRFLRDSLQFFGILS